MINLQEVFDVTWDITCAQITARREGLSFIHEFIFADPSYFVSQFQWYRVQEGKLSIIPGSINCHGEAVRGVSESGWGFKKGSIPKELMEAPITVISMRERGQKGTHIRIDVECNDLTVEVLKQKLADRALKWEDSPYE